MSTEKTANRSDALIGGESVSGAQSEARLSEAPVLDFPSSSSLLVDTLLPLSHPALPLKESSTADLNVGKANDNINEGPSSSSVEKSASARKKFRGRRSRNNNNNNKNFRKPYFRRTKSYSGPAPDNMRNAEGRRATWVSQRMQKYGKPIAPYNTTQFIMDDHNIREPDFEEINQLIKDNHSSNHGNQGHTSMVGETSFDSNDPSGSDEYYSSPDDEGDFLQRQFTETYENIHNERLSQMSKTELVQEYIALEEKVDDLEKKLKHDNSSTDNSLTGENSSNQQRIQGIGQNITARSELNNTAAIEEAERFQEEIKRLQDENMKLRLDNERLKSITVSSSSSDVSDGPEMAITLLNQAHNMQLMAGNWSISLANHFEYMCWMAITFPPLSTEPLHKQ